MKDRYEPEETRAAKAQRLDTAATVLFDRANSANGRAGQFRRIAWKLVYRSQLLKPWPKAYLRRSPPVLKRPKVPKAEREALKAMRQAKTAISRYGQLGVPYADMQERFFRAVENYCAVCGMAYKRPGYAK